MSESRFVITTSPGFEGEARLELRKLVPGAETTNLLLKGNVLLESPLPRTETLALLRDGETRCVASIVPVDAHVRVGKDLASLEPLKTCLPWQDWFKGRKTFVIRCRRRGGHEWHSEDLKRLLGRHIEERSDGIAQLVGETEFEIGVEVYQDRAYIGVYRPEQRLTKKLAGKRKYRHGQRPLNRAEMKLREALGRFEVAPDPTWRALDIGAAPGGWTRVLAERVAEVVAVDPGDLDPTVAELPNVRHLKKHAEDLEADEVGHIDLLVNDMNCEPGDSAAIMNALAEHLDAGATAIMTVKFHTFRWRDHLRDAKRALAPCYDVVVSRRLPHNRDEATLLLRRK